MNPITRTVGTTAAAALLALALPASAHAAGGVMYLDGSAYPNPVGCFTPSDNPHDTLEINNRTDQYLTVYSSVDCTGDATSRAPTGTFGSYAGESVYAP